MKPSLTPGLERRASFVVDRERTIDFMGEKARVYATPMLVRDIEMCCRELLLEHLDDGEDSVGTRVEVDHLAATLMGMQVEITVTLQAMDGRAASFEVQARDNVDLIARGQHKRFVVERTSTEKRLAAKAAKAGLA
jgi:fluoroacetyl-CoA thioesterase